MSFVIDVWIFYAYLMFLLFLLPIYAGVKTTPRLALGEGIEYLSKEVLQERYERRYLIVNAIRMTIVAATAYFVVRSLLTPASRDRDDFLNHNAPIFLIGAFGIGLIVATFWRYSYDKRFTRLHPAFSDSITSLGFRLGSLLWFFAVIGLYAAGFADDSNYATVKFVAALLLLLIGSRLRLKILSRKQELIPLDSPIGARVAQMVDHFGFKPKRFVLSKSLIANGYALPGGQVMLTTALRQLLNDDEVVAILAHEVSHARDKDVRRILASRMYALVGVFAGIGLGTCIPYLGGSTDFFFPLIFGGMYTFGLLGWVLATRVSRRLEFKCDAAAAHMGLGLELTTSLEKVHLFMGLPSRWVGLDRYLVTHPSLAERIAAIRAIEK